jgi:hypothetical protein
MKRSNPVLFTHTDSRHCTNEWRLTKFKYRGHSITKLPYIITVKWHIITSLHIAHLFIWSIIIIFQHNPQAHWCISPILAPVKNFITTKIRPLNSQPIMKSHFHFPIILQSLTCFIASVFWTALQVSFYEQWNDAHASSPVNSLFPSWLNFVNLWQDGANSSTLMRNTMKKMITQWNKWPTFQVVMTSHWFSGLTKPYNCTFLVGFNSI